MCWSLCLYCAFAVCIHNALIACECARGVIIPLRQFHWCKGRVITERVLRAYWRAQNKTKVLF